MQTVQQNIFIFRTQHGPDNDLSYIQDITKELGASKVIINLNVSDEQSPLIAKWKTVLTPLNLQLITILDTHLKKEYPFYDGAWKHGYLQFVEVFKELKTRKIQNAYYWFWEYDLRLAGSIKSFFVTHGDWTEDFLGTWVDSYRNDPDWYWWNADNNNYDQHNIPKEERYKAFAPVIRLSHRFMEKLTEVKDISGHIESYLPTLAAKFYGPESIDNVDSIYWERDYLYRYQPDVCTPNFFNAVLRFRKDAVNRLIHPVRDS